MKICGSAGVSQLRSSVAVFFSNAFREILGFSFWSRDLFEYCWKPQGFFLVLIFAPIRSSMPHEICSTPHGGLDISTTQMSNQNIILHPPYAYAYNLHMVDHSNALLGSVGF